MGILQNWTDILSTAGQNASEIYKKTAPYTQLNQPIMDTLCLIWSKYPKSVLLNPYARGFGRGMCSAMGKPVPPLPQPPWSGGQCPNIFYDITCQISRPNASGGIDTFPVFINNARGAIRSIDLVKEGAANNSWKIYTYQNPSATTNPVISPVGGNQNFAPILISITVVRDDGAADNCGSLPPKYPDDPTRNPSDFVNNTTYNIYNQAGNVINIAPVSINFNPTGNFTFPINFDIGGIDVTIDYDGISTPPPSPKPKPLPDENPDDYLVEPEPDKVATKKTFYDTLVYVMLDLTLKPVNAKNQWGAGAPDVYYCGWFEFLVNEKCVNRQPIHFVNNIFLAPDNANGYAYTLYVGFSGISKAYLKRRIVPPEGLPEIIPAP